MGSQRSVIAAVGIKAIKPDFDLSFAANMIKEMRAVGFEYYLDALKKVGLEK